MSAGIDGAEAVERGHNALSVVALEAALEAAKLVFTGALLGDEGRGTGAVSLLMVEREVLRLHHKALGLAALADCNAEDVGEHGVLRIVLMVTGVVGCSVVIEARPEDGAGVRPEAVLAHKLALALNKLDVECCGDNGLSREGRHLPHGIGVICADVGRLVLLALRPVYSIAGYLIGNEADRAVVSGNGVEADGVDRVEVISGSLHEVYCLFKSYVLKEHIPERIVDGDSALIVAVLIELYKIDKTQTVVCAPSKAFTIFSELINLVVKVLEHSLICGYAPGAVPTLRPVGAGEVLSGAGKKLVEVAVLKLVLNADGISFDILISNRNLLCAIHIDYVGIGGLLKEVCAALLESDDVVYRLVSAVADCEVVIAGVENPRSDSTVSLNCVLIVGGDVLCVKVNSNGLGCTRLKDAGLGEADELDSALLKSACGVRGLNIELNNVLTGNRAGVRDLDDGLALAADVEVNRLELLIEGGVGKTVAERVSNFLGIVPVSTAAGSAGASSGVALTENCVLIAGLIILIAYIDSFGLYYVPVALVITRKVRSSASREQRWNRQRRCRRCGRRG